LIVGDNSSSKPSKSVQPFNFYYYFAFLKTGGTF